MRIVDVITSVFLILGGINFGLMGFFDFNLFSAVFGEGSGILRVIYALVGLCALYEFGSLTIGLKETKERWCHTMAEVKH